MRGMDLTAEDFQWVTTEIMRVADLCCHGRLVSVLEGGYGNISTKPLPKQHKGANGNANPTVPFPTDSAMNRSSLCGSAIAHIKRLVDPYEGQI